MSNVKTPELVLSVSTGTILREPLNGSVVRHVKDPSWPDRRTLNITFSNVTRDEKDNILTTILAARPAGNITLNGLYGKNYNGVVKGDITIKQLIFNKHRCLDDALYDVSFIYEGRLI